MAFFNTVVRTLLCITIVSVMYYSVVVRPRLEKKTRPSALRNILKLENEPTYHVPSVLTQIPLPAKQPNPPPDPIACFVITFKHPKIKDPMRSLAHNNTAHMYKELEPSVMSFLATESSSLSDNERVWKEAGNNNILSNIKTNDHGTPFFRDLIEKVDNKCPKTALFVAYANADIMFDNGLIRTLNGLKAWGGTKLLIVGQRRNHDLTNPLSISSLDHVKSELFLDVAQDYFIMSRNLFGDWSTLPPYVIGRRAYDNALVDWAFHNANLVDATTTITALHQTTKDGNYAGHDAINTDKEYNVNLPGAVYDHGSTKHAKFKTKNCDENRVCVYNMENILQPANWNLVDSTFLEGTATSGKLFHMYRRSREIIRPTRAHKKPLAATNYPTGRTWAVITTIFQPTAVIKTLAAAKNWCTVVVGDSKSVKESEYLAKLGCNPECFVYLTLEKQLKLDYEIVKLIGINTFGRKNIGFVFAMHHGADTIYDTDDDNEIHNMALLELWVKHKSIGNWAVTGSNPYPAFGVSNIWPRGLPLDNIKKPDSYSSEPGSNVKACIIQSLANEEPDVDAIYRLTSPNYPVTFDSTQKASYVKSGVISPFNAQATVFTSSGFELMLLPVTVHGRVSDIWRGYIAQTVSIGCNLVFSSPWVTQKRNSHNYLADFDSELPLYTQASALVQYLERQTYSNVSSAMQDIYEHGIVDKGDVILARAWESDVQRAMAIPRPDALKFRHLFITMGKVHQLQAWIQRILSDTTIEHVDMVLGSFDQPMECPPLDRVECHFVSGTTWTTGRNALVKLAAKREKRLNISYDYWTISDADSVLVCRLASGGELVEHQNCFTVYDMFLQQVDTPMAALHGENMLNTNQEPTNVMSQQEAFDAAWNTVHHDALAVMFPYYPDLDPITWWSSQAIFWYRLQCFSPAFATSPLSVFYRNPDHHPYPRNARDHAQEKAIATKHFYNLSNTIPLAPQEYEGQIRHERIKSIDSMRSFSDWREKPLFQKCKETFTPRFTQWVESV